MCREGDFFQFLPGTGRGTMRSMVERHGRLARRIDEARTLTCPSTTFGGPPPRAGEDRERMDRHRPRLHLDRFAGARAVIGALAIDLDRRIGGRHLFDRPGKARQNRSNFRKPRPHVAGRNDVALRVEPGGLGPERDREIIDLARVEHAPAQLRRLAERDRQHARGKRVERPAMADLDLAQPGFAAHALHRGDCLRRAEPDGLVHYDPSVHRRAG